MNLKLQTANFKLAVQYTSMSQKQSKFTFNMFAFSPKNGRLVLRYDLDDTTFHEELTIPMDGVDKDNVDWDAFDRALFLLHMFGGIGYWKTSCPKNIVVNSGELTKEQAGFFNKIYTEGLGEFYYTNKIDFRGLVSFPTSNDASVPELSGSAKPHIDPLVPIGGGKDSITTVELLKKAGVPITLFATKPSTPIQKTSEIMNAPLLMIEREMDKQLFELNKDPKTFNGHVPITGYLMCIALLTAILHNKTDVIWSLEQSSSEANVEYLGMQINHQYSKSLKFEKSFQDYTSTFVTKKVRTFSLLRQFSELEIINIFSEHPEYFSSFASCNKNFTQKKNTQHEESFWCCDCPKCAFVFVALSGSLPHADVVNIFGNDLFQSKELLSTFKQLLGTESHKPFECVGTSDETTAAMELAYRRAEESDKSVLESLWMQYYIGEVRDTHKDLDALIEKVLSRAPENQIPEEYQHVVNG
jgi:UDP-N-acetyl-alpha-D-muramoyl-L-alanyl-L-glutamate epimerase